MTDVASPELVGRTADHTASEPPLSTPMPVPGGGDAVRLDRIAELQRRRSAALRPASAAPGAPPPGGSVAAGTPALPRRAGAANGSKVAAAGFGFAAMFGLVGAMGYAGRSSAAASEPAPTPAAPGQVVVVIHPADESAAAVAAPSAPVAETPSSGQPIVLSAQPIVRQAPAAPSAAAPSAAAPRPAAPSPAGQTNGSR